MIMRKRARAKLISYTPGPELVCYANTRRICLDRTEFLDYVRVHHAGTYRVLVYGGGAASQREAVYSEIYNHLFQNYGSRDLLVNFAHVGKVDPRLNLPTLFGGGKPRKRYRKSYR